MLRGIIKNQSVKQQIKINFFIVIILDIIFYVVMSFFGRYKLSSVFGILLGSGYGVFNFFLIGVGMERLILVSQNKLKSTAFFHYIMRYILMAVFIIVVIKISFILNIDILLFFVSLFFSKLAIFFQVFFEKENLKD